jgi:hypothetical protein
MPAQVATQLLAFPTSVFAAGQTYGPSLTPIVGALFSAYEISLNQTAWPASGDVLKVTVERSHDAGLTWLFDSSVTFAGGVWKDKAGNATTTGTVQVTVGTVNGQIVKTALTDLYRLTVQALQAASVTIGLNGIP